MSDTITQECSMLSCFDCKKQYDCEYMQDSRDICSNYKEIDMHTMNKGIPDCPDCGGKGMCDEHKREYLKWVYETARDEYYASLTEQITKLEEKIKQK